MQRLRRSPTERPLAPRAPEALYDTSLASPQGITQMTGGCEEERVFVHRECYYTTASLLLQEARPSATGDGMAGHVRGDKTAIQQMVGLLQPPLMGCDMCDLAHAGQEVPTGQKNVARIHTPLNVGLMTVVGLIFNTRAVSRMPLPLRLMSTICSLIAGGRPL